MVLLPLLRWWLTLELIGLVALPISMHLLRFLPERGICFRRAVGLVLCSVLLWLLVTLGLIQNRLPAAVVSVALVAAGSLVLVRSNGSALLEQLRAQQRLVLIEAVLFFSVLLLFGVWRA
ncbi:MAG: hypothetical protein GXY79_08635, partial [Chloroflexi bacterium]|nr:hypothetical protein [Chloroflexota bacterium]